MINVNSKAIIISIKNFVIIYSVWGINFISKLHRLCFNVIFYLIIIFFVYLLPLCYLKELISTFARCVLALFTINTVFILI